MPHLSGVAVITACAALAPRIALLAFLAARGTPDPRTVRAFDPFRDPVPDAMLGAGPEPERERVRTAGDRCVQSWRAWRNDEGTADAASGAAGALSVAAWCSWALGSPVRAQTRARYALDIRPDDPLAALVLRSVRAGSGPAWERE